MKITDIKELLEESQEWLTLKGKDMQEERELFPGRYDRITQAEDMLGFNLGKLKMELETSTAETELNIRKDPALFKLPPKPNEGTIKSRITVEPDIKELKEKMARIERLLRQVKSRAISLTYVKSMSRDLAMTASLNYDSTQV